MPKDHLISIDVGTTSIKVGLFTTNGKLKAMSTQEYTLLTPSSNMVELPADVYWMALGAGNIEPGIVTESTGTALAVVVCADKPVYDPSSLLRSNALGGSGSPHFP